MKELPRVFKNKVEKEFNNEQEVYYSNNISNKNIIKEINSIFNSNRFISKAYVELTLKDRVVKKEIIGKYGNNLLTIDNELININDILDIKRL